jgi:branched-chain amino acid transport system substrate-binding protein
VGRLCFIVLVWIFLSGIDRGEAVAAGDYDIDVLLPLTGGGAFLGNAEMQALKQYEKVVAATGGVHGKDLRFAFHDDQTSPQVAVQLTNQIKASNSPVVLGSALVGLCNAAAPLLKAGPVQYCFSPGIVPTAGGFTFSSSVNTSELAHALLIFLSQKGWKRIALITSIDATGQDAVRNFKALVGSNGLADVELVAQAQFNPTDVSVAAQIEKFKSANPDVVIAWTTGGPVGTVFKAIKDAGLHVPVATTDGNMTYSQMSQYAAILPNELYIPSPDWLPSKEESLPPAEREAKAVFFKAFDGTGITPDAPSTFAWDPALLVVEALRKLKPDASAEELRAYLSSLDGFVGVNGSYNFKAVPNRGLSDANVVVTRWDAALGTWVVVSDRRGALRH